MRKKLILEFDDAHLFDVISSVGDGGGTLGNRIVGIMLGGKTLMSEVGCAVYGLSITEENLKEKT